jgi:hypothetical protein
MGDCAIFLIVCVQWLCGSVSALFVSVSVQSMFGFNAASHPFPNPSVVVIQGSAKECKPCRADDVRRV